jgi:hypothetical protein
VGLEEPAVVAYEDPEFEDLEMELALSQHAQGLEEEAIRALA